MVCSFKTRLPIDVVVEELVELVVDEEEEVDGLDVELELEVDDPTEVLVDVEVVGVLVVVSGVPTFSHQLTSLMGRAAPTTPLSPSPSTSVA
jgi:hypothetical protein